jgi:hypothetical protein
MKRDFSLALSEKALRVIWRDEGLVKRKRRKHKTKQCLREVKRAWRLFEQTCVDTKDLCDIPELWAQAQDLGLPRYQYTAREVTSGWHYMAYAQECTLAYSKLFAEIILEHLQKCGVEFRDSRLQTDNGCEFVGNWQAKADSKFTEAVEAVKGLIRGVHRGPTPGRVMSRRRTGSLKMSSTRSSGSRRGRTSCGKPGRTTSGSTWLVATAGRSTGRRGS